MCRTVYRCDCLPSTDERTISEWFQLATNTAAAAAAKETVEVKDDSDVDVEQPARPTAEPRPLAALPEFTEASKTVGVPQPDNVSSLATVLVYGLGQIDAEASQARRAELASEIAYLERQLTITTAADAPTDANNARSIAGLQEVLTRDTLKERADANSDDVAGDSGALGANVVKRAALFWHRQYWKKRFSAASAESLFDTASQSDVAGIQNDATRIATAIVDEIAANVGVERPNTLSRATASAVLVYGEPDRLPVTEDELRGIVLDVSRIFVAQERNSDADGTKMTSLYSFVLLMGGINFRDSDDQNDYEESVKEATEDQRNLPPISTAFTYVRRRRRRRCCLPNSTEQK